MEGDSPGDGHISQTRENAESGSVELWLSQKPEKVV